METRRRLRASSVGKLTAIASRISHENVEKLSPVCVFADEHDGIFEHIFDGSEISEIS